MRGLAFDGVVIGLFGVLGDDVPGVEQSGELWLEFSSLVGRVCVGYSHNQDSRERS